MSEKSPEYYLEIEQKVIHLMLSHLSAVAELLEGGYGPDFFDANHRVLVQAIFAEYDESSHKRKLSRETYRQRLLDQGQKGNTIIALGIFDQCFLGVDASLNDLGSLTKQLIEAFIARKSQRYMQEFVDSCRDNSFLTSAQEFVAKMQAALNITETRRSVYASGAELKSEYLKLLRNQRDNAELTIRCGIPEIDNPMNVGFKPQHLTLFVADVGGHKTNMMINVALNLADRGHGVLFIPLEMNRFDLMNRMIANRTGVELDLLARPENMSDQDFDKIDNDEMWNKSQKNLHILDADERTSVSTLKSEIEHKAAEFKPRIVIVDYVDNLECDVRYGQRHIEIGEMLKSLRFMGKKYNFHTISAAQMGRAAIKALRDGNEDAVDSTAIHGSHQYSADSDNIFILMKIPNESDRMKVLCLKARHGMSGRMAELRVDPKRALISSTDDMLGVLGDSSMDIDGAINEPIENIAASVNTEVNFDSGVDMGMEL